VKDEADPFFGFARGRLSFGNFNPEVEAAMKANRKQLKTEMKKEKKEEKRRKRKAETDTVA